MLAMGQAFWWSVGIIIWFVVIIASVGLAMNKGRSGIGWGLLAAVFGIFALIVLALLKPKTSGVPS